MRRRGEIAERADVATRCSERGGIIEPLGPGHAAVVTRGLGVHIVAGEANIKRQIPAPFSLISIGLEALVGRADVCSKQATSIGWI